jgi:hypothetical protein
LKNTFTTRKTTTTTKYHRIILLQDQTSSSTLYTNIITKNKGRIKVSTLFGMLNMVINIFVNCYLILFAVLYFIVPFIIDVFYNMMYHAGVCYLHAYIMPSILYNAYFVECYPGSGWIMVCLLLSLYQTSIVLLHHTVPFIISSDIMHHADVCCFLPSLYQIFIVLLDR